MISVWENTHHHVAVPGSPGANDNAASVAILLALRERVLRGVRPGLRVRLLFPACEELGYLGARHYVREDRNHPLLSVGVYYQGGRLVVALAAGGTTELMLRAML